MKKVTFIIFLCFLFPEAVLLLAQKLNTDSIYSEAQRLAKTKDFGKAAKLCSDILNVEENEDIRFYLGLLYSWDKKYDQSRIEFEKVAQHPTLSDELVQAMVNNEIWAEKPLAAIEILNKALVVNPAHQDFLYQKAYLQYTLKRFADAALTLDALLKIDPLNEKGIALSKFIRINRLENAVMAGYTVDFIDGYSPWHLAYLQYLRKFSFGSLIGRVNNANRIGESDVQYELDAYINTWKKSYLYFNGGISGKKLFPESRMGFEVYQGLPKGFEVSGGLRYLKFTASDVFIYTGSVSKYIGAYWLSVRPYVIPNGDDIAYTGVFEARRIFNKDFENYLGIQYSYGSSPDEAHTYINEEDRLRIQSNKVKLTYSHRFLTVWTSVFSAAYEREENPWLLNKYTLEFRLQRLF